MRKITLVITLLYSSIIFSQDYTDSLLVTKKHKIELFSTKTVERIILNELNIYRSNLKINIILLDSTLYKSAKKYSLKMLKKDIYEHSKLPLNYIEFIGHNKIDIKVKITHKELALGILNGFLQTEQHKLVLMDPNITNIGIAVSSKLIKQNNKYYYNIYTTIHIYQ